MKNGRRLARIAGGWTISLALIGLVGCGGGAPRDGNVPPAYNSLRNFTTVYVHATSVMKHPPANAAELKAHLAKTPGSIEEIAPFLDGTDWVVQWGTDVAALRSKDNKMPVWVYAKNPQGAKRWVVQERYPVEMSEAEFRTQVFAPGMKAPF